MEDKQRKKLLNKYFYIPYKPISNKHNLLYINEKNDLYNFEDIDLLNNKINKNKKQLSKLKINSIKSIIINQNKIPQKWIEKKNYKMLLNKVINPNFVKFAQNYIEHNDINKKKEDLIMIKKMTEIKTPLFSTLTKQNNYKKNISKENSLNKINKNKNFGKSLNKILSYQGLNTESVNNYKNNNINRIMGNKNKLRSIPTEFNIITNNYNNFDNEIYINIKENSLKKNFKSIDNLSSRQNYKIRLPKINIKQ